MSKRNKILKHFINKLSVVLATVLIWRGVWVILDKLDILLFNGSHIITSVVGIIIGLIIIYLPDKSLEEL